MSTSSWPADALLGSPIPPPNWLDPRNRGTGWVAPGGWFTSSYRVPAEKIAFELDEINSCVNPPVVQGWAWCLAIAGLVLMLLGAKTLMGYRMMELPGIVLFLACVGLRAGDQFLATLLQGDGLYWMACASAITLIPLLVVGFFARLYYKLNYMSLCGLLSGSMTDPPALAFANSMAGSDAPSVSYATVYPLTMLLRVLMAQLLVIFFVR